MNKISLFRIVIIGMAPLMVTGCIPNGGSITFTADLIGRTPVQQEKSFTYKGHKFIYYNVYNDGSGNFVMADNTSYIVNKDIHFGLRVKSPFVYNLAQEGEEPVLIEPTSKQEDGYYNYAIRDFGFQIRGIGLSVSMLYSDINIGTITHWC